MSTKKNEVKRMFCDFRKDGSVSSVYDTNIVDEPFMGIVHNTINELADIWFEFVKDSKEAKKKVKQFEIIVRI